MDLRYYDNYRDNMDEASGYLNTFYETISADSRYGDYIKIKKGRVWYMMKVYDKFAKYNDDGNIYDIGIQGPCLKIVYTDDQITTVETLEWSAKVVLQDFITNNTTTSGDDCSLHDCDQQEMTDIVRSLSLS